MGSKTTLAIPRISVKCLIRLRKYTADNLFQEPTEPYSKGGGGEYGKNAETFYRKNFVSFYMYLRICRLKMEICQFPVCFFSEFADLV